MCAISLFLFRSPDSHTIASISLRFKLKARVEGKSDQPHRKPWLKVNLTAHNSNNNIQLRHGNEMEWICGATNLLAGLGFICAPIFILSSCYLFARANERSQAINMPRSKLHHSQHKFCLIKLAPLSETSFIIEMRDQIEEHCCCCRCLSLS